MHPTIAADAAANAVADRPYARPAAEEVRTLIHPDGQHGDLNWRVTAQLELACL